MAVTKTITAACVHSIRNYEYKPELEEDESPEGVVISTFVTGERYVCRICGGIALIERSQSE